MVVVAVHVSAPDASAPDFHRILFVEIDLDAEFGVLLADRLGAVASLFSSREVPLMTLVPSAEAAGQPGPGKAPDIGSRRMRRLAADGVRR